MNNTSHRHSYMKQPLIGISYGQWDKHTSVRYERMLLNGAKRMMVRKTTVRWIPISLEMYIRQLQLVQKDWRIEMIQFARRKFRRSGYQSKGIGE